MGIFAVRGRRSLVAGPEASGTLSPGVRLGLPHRFEAVGEALASGSDPLDACAFAGEELARDGASLAESLESLRTTWRVVVDADPGFEVVSAVVNAWSDTTLGYLHQLSCEDPMTGLASQAHLRSRISELYRAHVDGDPNSGHALVVCELPVMVDPSDEPGGHITPAMRLAPAGGTARPR